MTDKPTYEELERRVKWLEKEAVKRKKADKALYQSKKTYQNILSNIEDGYYEVDLAGNLTFFNDSLCKIYGYARDELMGMNNRNYMTTETAKKTYEVFNRVYKTGEPAKIFDWKFIKKDGTKVDVEISVSLIRNPKGQAIGFRGIVRDITERKRIEKKLQESKAMFKAVIENLPFDVFAIDRNNRYILQNATCKKNWGNFIEKSPEDITVNKHTKDLWLKNNRLAFSGETVTGEVVYDRLNGGKSYYYNIITPIRDREKIFGILGVLIDISELKQAEEAVRQSRERFRYFLENLSDAAYEADCYGNITYANKISEKIAGLPLKDITGKPFLPLFTEESRKIATDVYQRTLNGESPEYNLIFINGTICHFKNEPLRDKDGKIIGVFGIARDVTERKRIEEELRKVHDDLEKRVEERTRELKIQKSNLEETNIALQVLLEKRQEDKKETEDNVLTNVKELIVPYFEKIKKTKLDDQQKALLSIIGYNLNEIISPFTRKMSIKYLNLTPTEIHIANLIRQGSNSKEIAELMGLSPRTIYNHRKNIRKKLGLGNKKTNLRSHLLSIY